MKVRVQVIVESEHGETPCVEEVAQFERGELWPEALGLTLAEAKALLQGVQRTMVPSRPPPIWKHTARARPVRYRGGVRDTTSWSIARCLGS